MTHVTEQANSILIGATVLSQSRYESLPEDLRTGATVVTYDQATGARKVLRQGTNFLECRPRMADGFVGEAEDEIDRLFGK